MSAWRSSCRFRICRPASSRPEVREGGALVQVVAPSLAGQWGDEVWKAAWQLNYARTRDKYVSSHKQELQDWIVLLAFNHLMSGAEAFVSAHLWDFPATLKLQTMPDGRTGVGVTVPF